MREVRQQGVTLVEIVVVVTLVAILALALYPLISTAYESWRTTDRRAELLQVGRTGMEKLVRETRKAKDLRSCTDSQYIDFFPDWATSTVYRFNYDNTSELEFGTQSPVFINDSLAAPIDSFSYTTYTRRNQTGKTRHRQINAFRFKFEVSD